MNQAQQQNANRTLRDTADYLDALAQQKSDDLVIQVLIDEAKIRRDDCLRAITK